MNPLHHKVFVCHSLFFAFIDRAHPKHAIAEAYFRFFAEREYRVYTDSNTILICYNNLRKHMSVTVAKEFLRAVLWGQIEIIHASEPEERDALKMLSNNTDGTLTYQNCLLSVLSYRRNINEIATLDPFQPAFGQTIFTLPF